MRNRKDLPLDKRGYRGAEKNRAIGPQEVLWAREGYHKGELSAREIAERFDMALDSVRRMLRGDTYRNVGAALPREGTDLDDGGMMERLIQHQRMLDDGKPVVVAGEGPTGEEVIDLFLQSQPGAAQVGAGDVMPKGDKGEKG